MNIALGFDKKFSRYAGVTIKSILYNNKSAIKFYLMIDSSVSFFDKLIIKKMIVDSGNTVEFINMNNFFDGLFVGS